MPASMLLPVPEMPSTLFPNESFPPLKDCREESQPIEHLFQSFGLRCPPDHPTTMASWHSAGNPLHSRKWHRVPWDVPLELTPLRDNSDEAAGETFVVRGRDVSLGGVSFRHADPLPCRAVRLVHTKPDGSQSTFFVKLNWCRFTRVQNYLSGGRFFRP